MRSSKEGKRGKGKGMKRQMKETRGREEKRKEREERRRREKERENREEGRSRDKERG